MLFRSLLALGHPNVNLCNRTDEKARRLAEGTTVNTLPFASLSEAVWTYDIVILAVSMKGLLFSKAEFDVSRNNTKLIVDLGLPHNVDAQLGEYLKLVSISHLKEIAERNITKRQDQKEQVERIIQEELQALLDWHTYREKQIGMEC